MQRKLQNVARVYAHILTRIYQQNKLTGRLAAAANGARHLTLSVRLNDPATMTKALAIDEPLALACRVNRVIAKRVNGLISYQFELPPNLWIYYTRNDLPAGLGVGLGERRTVVEYRFDDAPHALFAGTSGSGKTTALASALIALLTHYSPAQLHLLIIDQKNSLSELRNTAHLLAPIATEASEAINLLKLAHQQFVDRKRAGNKTAPRLLVVIDEVSLLPDDDETTAALTALAKYGREYRVHLAIGDQEPKRKTLPDVMGNLSNRFVGQVDNAQTSALLTGHPGLHAHRLTGKGDFLHVTGGGNAIRFQVAKATAADFNRIERRPTPPATAAPAIVTIPETASPGRPSIASELDPKLLAYYVHAARHFSIAQAAQRLGFSRRRHDFYKQFTAEFLDELRALRGASG